MKNTTSSEPKSVSTKTEKSTVQPVRVSDMGMRRNLPTETKKQKLQPKIV